MDTLKSKLKGKFIVLNVYLEERPKINNLNIHLKKVEKEQIKSKVGRGIEILLIRKQVNEIEERETTKINQ